jgi:hypothetical protein
MREEIFYVVASFCSVVLSAASLESLRVMWRDERFKARDDLSSR